jgi:hypothetical protein
VDPLVCSSAGEAAAGVAAGLDVVLIAGEGAVPDLGGLRAAGSGRLALLVGDPHDPATASAAAEMAGELFRALPLAAGEHPA